MDRLERLFKAINSIVKEEADELKEEIAEFPALDATLTAIETYEVKVACLFRRQKKYFIDGLKTLIAKDEFEHMAKVADLMVKLYEADDFADSMADYTEDFLLDVIEEMVAEIMKSIDEEVAFNTLSSKATTWISEWSKDLAEMMKLTTHSEIEKVISTVIETGESIDKAIKRLRELPEFDRARARATAITEVLRANSVAAHEAYVQSPAVIQKVWKHSGSKKNKPRQAHVNLSGTVIGIDEKFDVNGQQALYPRDKELPAEEVINCHCVLGPVVDPAIFGLSKEEKQRLRDLAIAEYEAG